MLPSDTIIQSFLNGNDLAFVSIYNWYKHSIYIFCIKMVNDKDSAKDITQEVFIKAYERRQQLRNPSQFKSWLFAIARNDCITFFRKSKHTVQITNENAELILDSFGSNLDKEEELRLVNRAIDSLDPDLREVIILRAYKNLSYKEIAEVIGSTESVIKSRLFTARQRLFEIMKQVYIERKQL
jgi:RNA polymerase sigma-70 factor, ECF subfamily